MNVSIKQQEEMFQQDEGLENLNQLNVEKEDKKPFKEMKTPTFFDSSKIQDTQSILEQDFENGVIDKKIQLSSYQKIVLVDFDNKASSLQVVVSVIY